jgi:hypothetical protein
MLLELDYKKNDVISIKLTSGEEIIGRYVEHIGTHVVLEKPMSLQMGPQGVGIAQFMFTMDLDSTIKLDQKHCMVIGKTVKPMADQYIQGTTGISMG